MLEHFPESIVPARRKKCPYISSILSKNEINRDAPYNRKLFQRWKLGQYLFNPQLSLRIEGEWRRVYELLQPQRLAGQLRDPIRWGSHVWDPNEDAERAMTMLRGIIKELNDGRDLDELF